MRGGEGCSELKSAVSVFDNKLTSGKVKLRRTREKPETQSISQNAQRQPLYWTAKPAMTGARAGADAAASWGQRFERVRYKPHRDPCCTATFEEQKCHLEMHLQVSNARDGTYPQSQEEATR